MICRLSLLSISTFWDSYYYYRIGFFQGIFISFWSNIFESLLLYYVSCTNCEVFDKKIGTIVTIDAIGAIVANESPLSPLLSMAPLDQLAPLDRQMIHSL